MEFEKEIFEPITAKDDEWALFDAFSQTMHDLLRPGDPMETKEKRRQSLILQAKNPEIEFVFYGLYEPGKRDKVIGMFIMAGFGKESPSYEANKALMMAEVTLLPEYRRKGILRSLLNEVHDKMVKDDKMVLISGAQEEVGKTVAEKIGANIAQTSIENRVYMKTIDWDMMDDWISKGVERNPTSRLEFYEEIPDELMENYLITTNEVMNRVPKDDVAINDLTETKETIRKSEKDRKELGNKKITALIIEDDGEISSLSDLRYSPTRKQVMGVGLTGTLNSQLGKGKGKWVKAAIMKKAKDEYEGLEYVSTGNSTTNAPMLSINDRIGFKQYKAIYTVQMMRPELEAYLAKKV